MKTTVAIALLGLLSWTAVAEDRYSVNLTVTSNDEDSQYKEELLDELLYEFSLHDEIIYVSASQIGTNPSIATHREIENLPMVRINVYVADTRNGIFAYYVLHAYEGWFIGGTTTPFTYWVQSRYSTLGSYGAREIVKTIATSHAPAALWYLRQYYPTE